MNMGRRVGDGFFGRDFSGGGFASGARGGRRRKREGIALLESEDVAFGLRAVGADLQQIEFENGNCVGNKFGKRAVHVRGERGVHGVMKNVRHFRGDFGELRKSVTGGGAR